MDRDGKEKEYLFAVATLHSFDSVDVGRQNDVGQFFDHRLIAKDEKKRSYLSDQHLARIEQAHENSTEDLRRYYRVGRASPHPHSARHLLGF